jgi:GT2 family glycosyltransferase/glycosyltransferase involved in cell wall biosynthesis
VRLIAVSYSGVLGGAERLLLDVASGLPEPPELAVPEGPLAEAARARGLGVFELRERSLVLRASAGDRLAAPVRVAAHAAELRALVRSARPDAVIAWGMRTGVAMSAALAGGGGVPVLFQHNDLLPGPLIARATRAAAGRAALVVALSECVARDLDPSGRLGTRLRVVRPGVDLDRFGDRTGGDGRDGATDRADGNRRTGADAGDGRRRDCTALVLGAVEPWKRPDLALEATALAARDLPGLRVRLVGEPIGPEGPALLARLRQRAEQPDLSGRVELVGRVADPGRELAGADCLLHCADAEPYGLVVAEAMACGLPVVAPDSCGPAEILEPGCGRSYRPGSPSAAAAALVEVLSDPAEAARMGSAARATAERRLDLRATQARYAELVDELRAANIARPVAGSDRAGAGLAVVTVLHNSEAELATLLASLQRHLPDAQVVVVDSGSSDGGAELARGWRDGAADLLELGENVGFGRGVNAGLALVKRPVTVLLNPDTELLDASLAAAGREALRDPERLIAPLVLRPDGSREDNAQHEPGSPALLGHALVPGAALPHSLAALTEPWRARQPRKVGWAVASCLVARTELLRRLGPFDQRTFMYAEDLELGLRARDGGVDTVFWPAARVVHSGGHSARRAFDGEPFELLAGRRREVVRARRGAGRGRVDDLLQLATFSDRLLLKRFTGRPAERERRQLVALLKARRSSRR